MATLGDSAMRDSERNSANGALLLLFVGAMVLAGGCKTTEIHQTQRIEVQHESDPEMVSPGEMESPGEMVDPGEMVVE